MNGSRVVLKCFRCERSKPECYVARNCRFDKKVDGSPVNPHDSIAENFRVMKEDKQRKSGGVVGGSIHTLKGEVVPCWDEVLADEDPHDGSVMFDWAFVQGSHLEKDWKIDQDRKET